MGHWTWRKNLESVEGVQGGRGGAQYRSLQPPILLDTFSWTESDQAGRVLVSEKCSITGDPSPNFWPATHDE